MRLHLLQQWLSTQHGVQPTRTRKRWTEADDAISLRLREEGHPFHIIASRLGRTAEAVLRRELRRRTLNGRMLSVGPQPTTHTAQDDDCISALRKARNKSWTEIRQALPHISASALQSRWYTHLQHGNHPAERRKAWSTEEVAKLIHLRGDKGLRWSEVQQHLSGRGLNVMKAKYYVLTAGPSKEKRYFTQEELTILLKMRQGGAPYASIQAVLPSRSLGTLRSQYSRHKADLRPPTKTPFHESHRQSLDRSSSGRPSTASR